MFRLVFFFFFSELNIYFFKKLQLVSACSKGNRHVQVHLFTESKKWRWKRGEELLTATEHQNLSV